MPLLVVGSVAYDSIKTPHGELEHALGGAAVYFSLAAHPFTEVRLVGAVGDDFQPQDEALLRDRGIDLGGLERVRDGETLRWSGVYSEDMNDRQTLSVDLNVFEDYEPVLPRRFCDSRYVFLANGPPVTQASVLEQTDDPVFVMADTMDLWIQTEHAELIQLLRRIDGIMVNDSEALLLTECRDVMSAGAKILELGPAIVVIKKGEHGALLFSGEDVVAMPAFPTRSVVDPTGAGDSFAGAFMGHLARCDEVSLTTCREALACGTVAASFTVQGFGVAAVAQLTAELLDERFARFRSMLAI